MAEVVFVSDFEWSIEIVSCVSFRFLRREREFVASMRVHKNLILNIFVFDAA